MQDIEGLRRLVIGFVDLSTVKQSWLLTRFQGCDTDVEALKRTELTKDTLDSWKRRDKAFLECYTLLHSGLVGWEKALMRALEDGNALIAALELRKVLQTPMDTARGTTAKVSAINQAIERVSKRDTGSIHLVRIEDVAVD